MRRLFIGFFFIGLFFSCKEESDDQFPLVFISSPADNESYSVYDKIDIRASIQDNEIIKQVKISLYNSNSRSLVGSPISLFPNANTYQLNYSYAFADSLLPSGAYYFRVSASDGNNEASDFRTFNLTGVPRRLLDIIYAEEMNGYTDVMALNNAGNARTLFSFLGSCMELGIDARNQLLWLIDSTDRLMAYDLNKDNLVMDQQINNPGFSPLFTDLAISSGKAYISTKAGEIKGFNANLSDVFTYLSDPNKYVRKIAPNDKYVLAEELTRGTAMQDLVSIYTGTGARIASSPFSEQILGISNRNEAQSKIMSSSDSLFFIYGFDAATGLKNQFYQRGIENSINAISKIDEEWLIETNNGIYFFDQKSNFLNLLQSKSAKTIMEFSELSEEAYLATANEFKAYSIPLGNQTFSYSSSGTINGFALRYNY